MQFSVSYFCVGSSLCDQLNVYCLAKPSVKQVTAAAAAEVAAPIQRAICYYRCGCDFSLQLICRCPACLTDTARARESLVSSLEKIKGNIDFEHK